ncbi:hypothetical protein D9758_009321 [Tetrapyrgos nigripes]|uniref:DUF6534 domain-containing protein n=1 Tax=Tetrapyrgos nigripes TaxID=182062 RepID=A0A8H5GGY1_9AGAR|nr:hypothetical protein D9758_009321 [Tetrapyrgos nigripes]
MDAPHINLHKVLGSTLIGTWLNLMLYVLVIDRAVHYFQRYRTDRILIKIAVFAALASGTATTIAACGDVYFDAVTFQGNMRALQTPKWPRSVYLASTGISAAIVQTFMLHRYWSLTRRKVVTSAVGLVILLSLASTFYLCIIIRMPSFRGSIPQISPAVILWLSTAMAADLLIALILVLYYRSTDRDGRTLRSSRKLVHRLVILALKTGSFTALTAVLALVAFVPDIQSNVTFIFGECIGHIYTLTLLYNLNIRQKLIRVANPAHVRSSRIPDLESRATVPVTSNWDVPN